MESRINSRRSGSYKLAPIIICALFTGCATMEDLDREAAESLKGRFVYEREPAGSDDWRVLPSEGVVRGDCEDYALTLKYLTGRGDVYIAFTQPGVTETHVIWCSDGNCYDQNGYVDTSDIILIKAAGV